MSFPKFLGILTLVLFGLIGIAIVLKKPGSEPSDPFKIASDVFKASIDPDPLDSPNIPKDYPEMIPGHVQLPPSKGALAPKDTSFADQLPKGNLIDALFNRNYFRLPIVKTITYKSRVDWQPNRDAWLVDYATHYKTSRHFIARSLNNNCPVYDQQDVKSGDRFNVFSEEEIEFYLVVDASLCKLWLYYYDKGKDQRVLLKDYRVCLGRIDADSPSGCLTPYGIFSLGSRIATYGPDSVGTFRGQKVRCAKYSAPAGSPSTGKWAQLPIQLKDLGCTALPSLKIRRDA